MTRSAIDSIKGYYYQFDLTVLELLKLKNPNDKIIVENIEDLDIHTATESNAVQCKYYAKTEYNHSVIAPPIRQMLLHFYNAKKSGATPVNYYLYGHYKNGHEKLNLPITKDFLRNYLLTHTNKGVKIELHKKLKLSDFDLDKFISNLKVDINAPSYDTQIKDVFQLLKKEFNCSEEDAQDYYYNNSLRLIKDTAVQDLISRRTVSRKGFITSIDRKDNLFHNWYAGYMGREKFFRKLKKDHFTLLNISAYDRFFLVGVNPSKYRRHELKEIIHLISKKWSKLSKKEPKPFCPYLLILGITETELIEIKVELFREGFGFIDGHNFLGSDFCIDSMLAEPNHSNTIKIKFVNELNQLDSLLYKSNATKQVFQFYNDQPFYDNSDQNLKHVKIQVHNINEIKKII